MSSTAKQALETILKHGGKARKWQIARELKISLEYAGLICEELKEKGEVAFSGGFYFLTSTKKDASQDKGREIRKVKKINPEKTKESRVERNNTSSLGSILGISEPLARTLWEAGYITVESLAEAPISRLMEATKLQLPIAARLINQARGLGDQDSN